MDHVLSSPHHALFLPVLLMSYMFTCILSMHTFYAYFTHGPNTSAPTPYENTRGAWLTQEGCTIMERNNHAIIVPIFARRYDVDIRRLEHRGIRNRVLTIHCKNKKHLHVLRWDTCVLKETHTHVYGQTYMFLNKRMCFYKLHITCFTITWHILELHIGCFKITHWVF